MEVFEKCWRKKNVFQKFLLLKKKNYERIYKNFWGVYIKGKFCKYLYKKEDKILYKNLWKKKKNLKN